jgi:hypothetical protein
VYLKLYILGSLRRYPYFAIVVGLAWSDDPDRYAGCTVTTGRVSHAKEVKSGGTDKQRYPAAPGRGLSEGLRTPSLKNTHCCEDPQ